MRTLLAVDHSDYSAEAIKEIAIRPWPPSTIVRVLSVVEPITPPASELLVSRRRQSGACARGFEQTRQRADNACREYAQR